MQAYSVIEEAADSIGPAEVPCEAAKGGGLSRFSLILRVPNFLPFVSPHSPPTGEGYFMIPLKPGDKILFWTR